MYHDGWVFYKENQTILQDDECEQNWKKNNNNKDFPHKKNIL